MATATEKTHALAYRLTRAGIDLDVSDVEILRRAERTLQSCAEQQCNGNLQRDEETGKTFYCNTTTGNRWPTRDLESGALRRVREVCKRNGLHYFHQGDPRGCALYVSREPIESNNYNRPGCVPCCGE